MLDFTYPFLYDCYMIAYVNGRLEATGEDHVIVDVGGIAWEISTPSSVLPLLPSIGEKTKLHTYLHVREDAMQLFGFVTRDDLDVFKKLLTVNGIGPKAALGILSVLTADDLRFAVMSDNVEAICKAPGVGKKTAQKLILDMKDKLKINEWVKTIGMAVPQTASAESGGDIRQEAVEALVSLGYTQGEAVSAVSSVHSGAPDVETLIKAALKQLAIL